MFKNLKRFTKEYFSFSSSERKAIWLIMAIIILLIFLPSIYREFHQDSKQNYVNNDFAEFDSNFKLIEKIKVKKAITIERQFDPNKLSKNEWVTLGLNVKTACIIENYLKKGGKFRRKTDLLKIHGFDTSFYYQISDSINISGFDTIKKIQKPNLYPKPYKTYSTSKKNKEILLEINSADSIQFDELNGIGKILASRIIKFRNLLGGFYSITQLNEVHGLMPDTYDKISVHIFCDSLKIQKINLNAALENDLRKHPYIGKYKAGLIVKYRNFVKTIQNSNELVVNNIITKEEYQKLHYYLK